MESALYVVATPIGNLKDITLRAIEVLKAVDCIAAEDTRHTRHLLDALGISTKMLSLHEHNEYERAQGLLDRVLAGENIALVSDAGTPLISDPGSILVRRAREMGVKVVPLPGACALIAALSVSGIDSRRFSFEGFLPAKASAKLVFLQSLANEPRTMVFYESPHRILNTLDQMAELFPDRSLVLARELTKTFETVVYDTASGVRDFVQSDGNQRKGEFVLVLQGQDRQDVSDDWQLAERLLPALLQELPPKKAAGIVAGVTDIKKNELYQYVLSLKKAD